MIVMYAVHLQFCLFVFNVVLVYNLRMGNKRPGHGESVSLSLKLEAFSKPGRVVGNHTGVTCTHLQWGSAQGETLQNYLTPITVIRMKITITTQARNYGGVLGVQTPALFL